jgi:hypothetical protein
VSLLSKSELRLRIGHEHCDLGLWQGLPWRRSCVQQVRGQGSGRAGIDAALAQLATAGTALPQHARLVIEDELVFYTLLPAGLGWGDVMARAERYFDDALGLPELQIELALAPGGRHWIAAALPGAELDPWLDALEERQIEVVSLRLALLEDLQQVRRQIAPDTSALALVREHGALVLGLDGGAIDRLSWERIDWHDTPALLTRLGALRGSAAQQAGCLVPTTRAQHAALDLPGRQSGWQVLPALAGVEVGA